MTKKKLELTRLPHERPDKSEETGKDDEEGEGEELSEDGVVTKREIEGLVDYWYVYIEYSFLVFLGLET